MTAGALERLRALAREKGAADDAEAVAELEDALARLEAARQTAEAANEAKTRFLISVSHEIRSPLNAIYGYAQLLERGDGQGALRAAQVIRRSSEHLSHLIEGLLDISQVESGTLRLSREPIALREFCQSVVDMLDVQAQAKGLALVLDCPPGLPAWVRGDQKRLRQVLINLVSNAIKFTREGEVRLRVHYRNELATFDVEDTGIGIAATDLERIFQPFSRVSAGGEAQPGIGLGLSITQALVHIMGGDIRVTSEPGKGSRFTVRLMLSQPHSPPAAKAEDAQGQPAKGHRILVVDDDPAHVAMVSELLESAGFRLATAQDSAAAYAQLDRRTPDLILLDVSLGAESGWDIAATVRQRFGAGVKIVMLSGEVSSLDPGIASAAADAFITKPFAFDGLLRTLAALLGIQDPSSDHGGRPPARPSDSMPPLPACARQPLDEIERLIRIGHVRAIEHEIDRIVASDGGARAIADRMRSLLDAFDLPALAELVKGARVDGA